LGKKKGGGGGEGGGGGGGEVGAHAPRGTSVEGASVRFLQSFKNAL